jgi:hypothetical protein
VDTTLKPPEIADVGLFTEIKLDIAGQPILLIAAEAYGTDEWHLYDESIVVIRDPSIINDLSWLPPRPDWQFVPLPALRRAIGLLRRGLNIPSAADSSMGRRHRPTAGSSRIDDVLVEPSRHDLDLLRQWWARLAPEIPPDTKGLWFGITDLQHGGALRTLYVAGCPTFDPADPDGEWATEYSWWPEDRYITLEGFALLPDQPYQEVLTYAADLIRHLDLKGIPAVQGAAVGFDDGDFAVL